VHPSSFREGEGEQKRREGKYLGFAELLLFITLSSQNLKAKTSGNLVPAATTMPNYNPQNANAKNYPSVEDQNSGDTKVHPVQQD
jgi:hypothetical protein